MIMTSFRSSQVFSLRRLSFLPAILLSLVLANAAGAETVDRIVAVVNEDIISLFDLNEAMRPLEARIEEAEKIPERREAMRFKLREDMLRKLVDQKLTDQEIKRAGITVGDQEVNAAIERIKSTNFYTDEQLREGLKREGLTYEEYRERLRDQILRSKLVAREVKSKIVITEEEIKAYYEAHPDQYKKEKRIHLKNILIRSTPGEEAKARARMEEAVARIKAGDPFDKVAAKYSESPLASSGGELGTFALSQLAPVIREALEGKSQGDVSDILDTPQGLQVFYIAEENTSPGKSMEDGRAEIEEKLYEKIVNERFDAWLKELRDRSHIKIVR